MRTDTIMTNEFSRSNPGVHFFIDFQNFKITSNSPLDQLEMPVGYEVGSNGEIIRHAAPNGCLNECFDFVYRPSCENPNEDNILKKLLSKFR